MLTIGFGTLDRYMIETVPYLMNDAMKNDYASIRPGVSINMTEEYITNFELFGDIKLEPKQFCELFDQT